MITLTREEAQQVLDDLEALTAYIQGIDKGIVLKIQAIETLRARLSAPEPTLVLWNVKSNRLASPSDDRAQVFAIRKLEWQGLTDEERYLGDARSEEEIEYARAIEAKLKEKNT
jgi:hypothetical protein